jgi:arginine decarboxylase
VDKNRLIIHNGYKTEGYLKKIVQLQENGFKNSILILDSTHEIDRLEKLNSKQVLKIGIRMSINEEAQSAYYTSRLGIPSKDIVEFFNTKIKNNDKFELKMLHFFVDSGIKDTLYYWGEFQRALKLYTDLKKESENLISFNLGGGFPIKNSLGFEYDYEYMINEIVKNIKEACEKENVLEPDLFTEFGKYTVGEAGAIIFEVLEQKHQNDTETWYIINNSLMNTIPDAWSINEKFILLPVNKWNNEYRRVNIGGISCDHSDYYNYEDFNQEVLLPKYENNEKEPLYLGFFHTGAYQDSISGYGGIKHCLIPSPKHVIIDRDDKGNFIDYVYREEQSAVDMFNILGYNS